ncbi:MAG: hypothetical protein J6A45_02925, partial [Lachnospiraceae bacterium]|nr:hypothetical protein [Lachnospiraceae bacterium]
MSKSIKTIIMLAVICGFAFNASSCVSQTVSAVSTAVVLQQPGLKTEQMQALSNWFEANCEDERPVVALPDELLVQYEVYETFGQSAFRAAKVTADDYGDIIRDILNYRDIVDVLKAKPALLMHEVEYIVINQEFDLGGFLAELDFEYVDVVNNYA